jgi:trehalose synthase
MIRHVPVAAGPSLDDYAATMHLTQAVASLRAQASQLMPKISGRRLWLVNSTAQGGGVAEMLPTLVSILRELGVDARWVAIGSDDPGFFPLTKRIHNAIHGMGEGEFTRADQQLYAHVNDTLAAELAPELRPEDVLVVHDPQPAGMGARLRETSVRLAVWRSHIGLDSEHPQATRAWRFLEPYLKPYDRAVFSAEPYVPACLADRATVISPGIDPFSHKNRELSPHKIVGVLCNAGLMHAAGPVLTPPFEHSAERLRPDGAFAPMGAGDDIELLLRPIVTQVSRWDRLKGFEPLMEGFALLKRSPGQTAWDDRQRRRIELARLVLAGPEPSSVDDDPEAGQVLHALIERYRALPADIQRDIVLVSLPMHSGKENSLMVNALQRCSSLVVQNSLREGFGLTVTEAMWKQLAVLGSTAAGICQQIRHGVEGHLNPEPGNPAEVARALVELLNDPHLRARYAQNGQRRVHEDFLIFSQLRRWFEMFAHLL